MYTHIHTYIHTYIHMSYVRFGGFGALQFRVPSFLVGFIGLQHVPRALHGATDRVGGSSCECLADRAGVPSNVTPTPNKAFTAIWEV